MVFMAFQGNVAVISRHCTLLLSKVSPNTSTKRILQSGNRFLGFPAPIHNSSKFRYFSYIKAKTEPSNVLNKDIGTVTRQLKKLDMSVVRRIEEELQKVDKNSDGR